MTSGRPAFQQHIKRTEGSNTPLPRTFRKYCAQSEKTATSPNCKKITQPSGAATPRNSDAHKRIAVPRLSAFFESALDQGSKAAKFAVLIPGHAGFPKRVKRSEGRDTTPHPKRPCFAVCAAVCDFSLKAECVPAFTRKSERGPFVRKVEKWDEKRLGPAL